MDALNTEMAGHAGHVNKVVPFAPPPADTTIFITGSCLEGGMRGMTGKGRADIGAQLVNWDLTLIEPLVPMAAHLVRVSSELVHRALGHAVRPPCSADMLGYVTRFGVERTERLIAQIKAVAAGEAA